MLARETSRTCCRPRGSAGRVRRRRASSPWTWP